MSQYSYTHLKIAIGVWGYSAHFRAGNSSREKMIIPCHITLCKKQLSLRCSTELTGHKIHCAHEHLESCGIPKKSGQRSRLHSPCNEAFFPPCIIYRTLKTIFNELWLKFSKTKAWFWILGVSAIW